MRPPLPRWCRRVMAACLVSLICHAATRPNIVWIVSEDMSPDLGCYGVDYARTPNLDRFAAQGARFARAFTHAPVCAPSRSGLITGQHPTTIGTHHMRSRLLAPPPTFTSLLREAGYFVAWPGKTDFNFNVPDNAFDSTKDWLKTPPAQPFFAYVNFTQSHESQIRTAESTFLNVTAVVRPEQRHDPAKARLPAYYPDTPEVRRDWARYHDLVTTVDHKVGEVLRRLDETGLATNTIVFYFGDHGRGLPRAKRWVYDSGTRVPLLIRWPGNIQPGSVREDLVCFLDFAPTVLALAGAAVPTNMPGRIILGPRLQPEPRHVFSARDRMDETYDRIRSARDRRYRYIRNFRPELPYAQRIAYMEEMPTMQSWRREHAAGRLTGPAVLFFAPTKPVEELYDLDTDPDEVRNLAADPAQRGRLVEFRASLEQWMRATRDLGGETEEELIRRGLVEDKLEEYAKRRVPGFRSN